MFRRVYDQMWDYTGDSLYESILLPLLEAACACVAGLSRFRRMSEVGGHDPENRSAAWELYALGRVNDFLLLPFQDDERGSWDGPRVSRRQYRDFFMHLGLTPVTCGGFSPFACEIVKVDQAADPAEPVRVVEHLWPGLRLGELMFSRSGVRVAGGSYHVVKEVAETSTLHFTHRRLHRRTQDLSMGWGSNSQWRTDYRRDYEANGRRVYHSQGSHLLGQGTPPPEDRDGLTADERMELCRHRCFIRTRQDDTDLWPYDDRWEEPQV